MKQTPHIETEALLAVMRAIDTLDGDQDSKPDYAEAQTLLAQLLPNELRSLALASNELRLLIWRIYEVAPRIGGVK